MDMFVVKRSPNFVASYAASRIVGPSVAQKKARQGNTAADQRAKQYPKGVYYDDDLNNVHWLITVLFYVLQNIE